MVNHGGVEQQVLSGQQEVDDVVLRRPDGDAAADAQVAQDVQHLGIAAEFLQKRNNHLELGLRIYLVPIVHPFHV